MSDPRTWLHVCLMQSLGRLIGSLGPQEFARPSGARLPEPEKPVSAGRAGILSGQEPSGSLVLWKPISASMGRDHRLWKLMASLGPQVSARPKELAGTIMEWKSGIARVLQGSSVIRIT